MAKVSQLTIKHLQKLYRTLNIIIATNPSGYDYDPFSAVDQSTVYIHLHENLPKEIKLVNTCVKDLNQNFHKNIKPITVTVNPLNITSFKQAINVDFEHPNVLKAETSDAKLASNQARQIQNQVIKIAKGIGKYRNGIADLLPAYVIIMAYNNISIVDKPFLVLAMNQKTHKCTYANASYTDLLEDSKYHFTGTQMITMKNYLSHMPTLNHPHRLSIKNLICNEKGQNYHQAFYGEP